MAPNAVNFLTMLNAATFASTKLTESNFTLRKEQIICLLESHDLLGFVDGTITEPSTEQAGYRRWKKSDRLVKGWILGCLSDEMLGTVTNKPTARDVWVALEADTAQNNEGPMNNTSTTVVSNNDIYFSNLSMVNAANFISVKLTSKSNFPQWETQIRCLLRTQGLVGYIDNTDQSENEAERLRWQRIDSFVKGWILGSLSDEILRKVANETTATDVWVAVEREIYPEVVRNIEDYSRYLPLYKASQCGDWKKAEEFLHSFPEACRAPLNILKQTALHIAVGVTSDKGKDFVEKLVDILPNEDLAIEDNGGLTPLHYAAKFGNLYAARVLVSRDANLPHVASSMDGLFPIHNAAEYSNISTDVYEYFSSVTTDFRCYTGRIGLWLIHKLIHSSLYDYARELVEKYPDLAQYDFFGLSSALKKLAMLEFTFLGGSHLNFWQQLLYYYYLLVGSIPRGHLERPNANDLERQNDNDMETEQNGRWFSSIYNRVHYFQTVIKKLGSFRSDPEKINPRLKHIRDMKRKHHTAVELAECLCQKMENVNDREIDRIIAPALIEAARCGSYKLVEMIVKRFPSLVFSFDGDGKSIFHIAIENRCENVYNLVYQIRESRHHLIISRDSSGNTMLHSAARLAQQDKLNLIPGAALQMQRELQWFEEVKKLMPSSYQKIKNYKGELAEQLFNEEHKQLKEAGEKWMKETSTSLTISAALVATIAFAAAITVPGGNNGESGLPIFSRNIAFIIFFISNAASLFTSTTSLLVFLSVFTSRYRPEDFLRSLPKRLAVGLLNLIISITCMMVSFSATVYLVFRQKKAWMIIPMANMACSPIISFVFPQLPLLYTLITNIYFGGIFGRKTLDGNYIKGLFSRMRVSIKRTCDHCWNFWKENCGRPLR